jgi:glucose 1-dehydrogenase
MSEAMQDPSSSRVAVITGAGRGIGAAIATAFAASGMHVVLGHLDDAGGALALADKISQGGARAITVQADVAALGDLQRLVDRAVQQFGRLDVMVNNAGIQTHTSVLDSTEADYDRVLAVNLKGAFFGTQFAARQMIAQVGGGVVLNISSVHEAWASPGNTPYALSKGGVRQLTRTAALDLARHGIRVVGIGPGAVATPMNADVLADAAALQGLKRRIPLDRLAEAKEIAALAVFLTGDGARYITGTTVFADGGIMLGHPPAGR